MADQVVVCTRIRAATGKEESLKELCLTLAASTRDEAGAVVYDLYQNTQDATYFMLHEVWTGMEAITGHMQTSHFGGFMGAAPALLTSPGEGIEGPFEVMIATPFNPEQPPTTPAVTVATRTQAKEGMAEAAKTEILSNVVTPSRAEEGCAGYDLYQNVQDASLLLFHEQWKGFEAVGVHMQTPHFGAFMGKAPQMLQAPSGSA